MAEYLEYRSGSDHNGYRASVYRPKTGQNAPVIVAPQLVASTSLSGPSKVFAAALEATVEKLTDGTNRYSEPGFHDWAKPEIFRPLGQAFRAQRDAAVARRSELHAKRSEWAMPAFPKDDQHAPLRAELRGRIGAMKPMQGVEAATRNFEMATAMAEGGEAIALAMGWTPDIYARFIDGFIERNLANRLIGQHGLTLKPTVNDILRDGPDDAAAIRAAREYIDNLNSSFDEIDAVEVMLGSAIDFVAVTMDTDRITAFDTLMAA